MADKKKSKSTIEGVKEVIRTTFDGLPIKDGESKLLLTVHTEDVDKAAGNEQDAMNCILAKACQRQMHSATVAFFRTVAYIEHADAKGVRGVYRYLLSPEARSIIEAFDRGKNVKGEVCIELLPPMSSRSLDGARARSKANYRKALLKGHIKNVSNARQFAGSLTTKLDIRNGTGLVKSILKPAMTT
jgi:hypothetical protein